MEQKGAMHLEGEVRLFCLFGLRCRGLRVGFRHCRALLQMPLEDLGFTHHRLMASLALRLVALFVLRSLELEPYGAKLAPHI